MQYRAQVLCHGSAATELWVPDLEWELRCACTGRQGVAAGSSSDEGDRAGVQHGRDAHDSGSSSLPFRASPPAAAPADVWRGRSPAMAQAGISTAEARLFLEQLAARQQANAAQPAAAHQAPRADLAAAPQHLAAALAVAVEGEAAGPVIPIDSTPFAAVRELLTTVQQLIMTHARRYTAECAALGRLALGLNWDFVIDWSREAALEVCARCCQLVHTSMMCGHHMCRCPECAQLHAYCCGPHSHSL